MARRIPSWLKPPLRAIKRAALGARRLVARQLLAPFAAKAPASKDDRKAPLRFRAAFALYFAKRLLQERYARGWPRRARFAAFKLEMQSAFVIKLQQWADFPLGWAPDPYAAQRRNQTLFPAEAERQRALAAAWERKPTFTVLVPVWNAKREWLDRLIGSVLGQTYAEWTLLLVDDCSTLPETAASLSEWAARDSRITVHRRDKNGGVTAASNDGLSLASGEFVAFADHDDELLPDALWEMASAIRNNPGVDLLYSDEEYVPPNGAPYPAFKPGWSPELLTAYNYICHLLVVRRARIEEIRGFRTGTEGAQDFDLILRLMPRLRKVVHVPRVLYRWHLVEESISRGKARDGEVTARTSLDETTRKVVQDHFERLGIAARIDIVGGWARPSYVVKQWPAVAVIICSRDNPVLLDLAMESLVPVWETVNWTNRHGMEKDDAFALALAERNIKLILVDNGSTTPEAQAFYERHRRNFVVLRIDNGPEGFNWSALNNAAARLPEVEHLLFLNDDVEANPKFDWYQELVGAMAHKGVGVAGAMLKYPDGKIQHAGVICGAHGWGPWHVLMGARIDDPNAYQGMVHFPRNVAAVTGACLMTRADVFRKLGGFDERRLKVGFSDIDYCHRVRKLGYRIAYVPQAELIHKEGQSRGKRIDAKEAAVLAARQRGIVDPYWNPHFTRETHIPTVCSRRKARRLCHPNGPHVLFIGEETLPGSIGPKWEKLAFEWTGKGKASKYFLDDDEAGLAHAIAALDPDAVFANGTAGVAAVELAAAAGIPSVWQLPERLLLPEEKWRGSELKRLLRALRAMALPYQVAFSDPHSRAFAMGGWMRENARVVERVVPRVARAKAGRDRAAARERLGIGPGEFLVGFGPESAGAGGAPARVRALRLSAAMLPAADVAVCMPFRDLRSEFALTALAYGIPIVGTRLLEHADLMHEGVTGIEIPEGDPAALCEALELLAENPDLLTRMGRQSRWWLASRAHPMTVREMWVELLWEAAEIGLARRPARENRAAGSFPGESAPRVES